MGTGALPDWVSRFENDAAVIYVLDQNFCLRYCNQAWDRFASENGGNSRLLRKHQIGASVLEATPPPLKRFYAGLYARVLYERESEDHVYDCSSPDRLRRFHMRVERFGDAKRERFLVVVNSLVLEAAIESQAADLDPERLRQENGLITMCAHCRRTLSPDSPDQWIWVPQLLRCMPPEVSHGFCPVCFEIHYGRRFPTPQ